MITNHEVLKQNEYRYQNKKYSKTSLNADQHLTSIKHMEASYLAPKHEGGHERGYMFREALTALGTDDLAGKRILDYCCGRGDLGIYLSMKGAEVYGFDFSPEAIKVAQVKNRANRQSARFAVMDAEGLEYTDAFFDAIIGFEAIHHVIVHPGVPGEIARVLKPGGIAVFAENYGHNPVLELYRRLGTLRRNKSNERGEVILKRDMVQQAFTPHFEHVEMRPISMLYMAKRKINNLGLLRKVFLLDQLLLSRFPALTMLCGESIVTLRNTTAVNYPA